VKGQVPTCHCCQGEAKRSGHYRNKNFNVQRYQCTRCGKSFSEKQPLDGLRIDFRQACQVVNLLCEGMGVRAAARVLNIHRDTVLAILETAGPKFEEFSRAMVKNVKAEFVQIDELWTFVNCKPQNAEDDDPERGGFFTFLSVERDSKLLINWLTGKRDAESTRTFLEELRLRVPETFQLTSDAYPGYVKGTGGKVREVFGDTITYATEIKVWGRTNEEVSRWFNPLKVVGIKRQMRIGTPDLTQATTCHVERTNLSVRTFTRRFTRCTIGYSKTLANLRHAVGMFVCHFNFCRKHRAHGKTPAMAAGLTDRVWKIEEILQAAA